MPVFAARPCRHPGCHKLVRNGSGYCEQHQADRNLGKFGDSRRGSRQSRGYGAEWEQKRKKILSRDKGLCVPCREKGRINVAKHVDHKVNKALARLLGWSDEQIEADDNLQSICVACHREKTQSEATQGRLG